MNNIVLGDVSITRVMEYYGSVELSPKTFFPDSLASSWAANETWLAPDFYDPAADMCISAVQTWVLHSEGKTILVDTGVGNHKERPGSVWHRLETDFLGNLAAAGIAPGDVDIVINTHLHNDHVGWNTTLRNGTWEPTFPNATYLMPRADFDFWNPANGHPSRFGPASRIVFEDSIAPVHDAGLVQLWDGRLHIDGNLRLDLAPGHTPGSSIVTLETGGDRALFVGDLLHTPLQVVEPDVNSCYCEDEADARATRRRLLGQAADTNTLVFPAHLGGHGGAEVVRKGDTFEIRHWAPFERVTHV